MALIVDPGDGCGRVDDLAVIKEHIAPGDRIPLHVHRPPAQYDSMTFFAVARSQPVASRYALIAPILLPLAISCWISGVSCDCASERKSGSGICVRSDR